MSLAPIEAGALRQNKLTDHFFVAPTDRRFWDKVHKSRSFGFHSGSKVHQRLRRFIYWGLGSSAWVASKAFFIQRYLVEHVCGSSVLLWAHAPSLWLRWHFRAQQHFIGWLLLNTSPTGLSSPGARPLLWRSTMELGPGWPGPGAMWPVGGMGSGAMSPSKSRSLDSGSL